MSGLDPVFRMERRRLLDNCAVFFRPGCDARSNVRWMVARKASQHQLATFRAAWRGWEQGK